MPKQLVYIGTSTSLQPAPGHRPEGIFIYEFDDASGKLTLREAVSGVKNPSFLAMSPDHQFMYVVSELSTGGDSEALAYAVDPATGGLTLLNRQPIDGAAPCYVSLDRQRKWALVANYTGGSALVFPIRADGRLGEAAAKIQHTGVGVHPQRQEAPHIHSILLDPTERYALLADFGLDRVFVYRFDHTSGQLSDPVTIPTEPGAGPRHLAFHFDGRRLYVINELASTLSVYEFNAEDRTFSHKQTLSTLPAGFGETNYSAHVQIAPSGRFLYASNRGHDSIAVFALDPDSGLLSPVEVVSTRGQWPRHFAFDTTGGWLLVGNQNSGTVTVFQVDPASGRLAFTGEQIAVPTPLVIGVMNRE